MNGAFAGVLIPPCLWPPNLSCSSRRRYTCPGEKAMSVLSFIIEDYPPERIWCQCNTSSAGNRVFRAKDQIIFGGKSAVSISYCQRPTDRVSQKFGAELVDGKEKMAVDGQDYITLLYVNIIGGTFGLYARDFKSVVSHSRVSSKPNPDQVLGQPRC